MIINVSDNGKSLKDSPKTILPEFTIITGENGAGKSQLLEAIYTSKNNSLCLPKLIGGLFSHPVDYKKIVTTYSYSDQNEPFSKILLLKPGLTLEETESFDIIKSIRDRWPNLLRAKQSLILSGKDDASDISDMEIATMGREVEDFIKGSFTVSVDVLRPIVPMAHINREDIDQVILTAKTLNKSIREVNELDSLITFKFDETFFSPKIDLIVHQYYLGKKKYPEIYKEVQNPVNMFNEILEMCKSKFRIIYNESENDFIIQPLKIQNNGAIHDTQSLSSGEKTILTIALAMYNVQIGGKFPEVLLLDEPDSMLHPSMAKIFIDVVEKWLVGEKKVQVIMTTHSPSTVALAPESSLFFMEHGVGYPQKIDRESAIKSLTDGLQLRVSPQDEMQVFVESDYDEYYYDTIYRITINDLPKNKQLHFVSSGHTKIASDGSRVATCDQVILITKKLREYKNTNVWGIVDWDKKQTNEPFVVVNGSKFRYAIENYLIDPILIALALIKEEKVNPVKFGLNNSFRYVDTKNLDESEVQKMVHYVLNKINKSITETDSLTNVVCEYKNGMKINIPEWFLHHQGHRLEELIVTNVFPQLKALKSKTGTNRDLKSAMLDILKDFPGFISVDFETTFKSIITAY